MRTLVTCVLIVGLCAAAARAQEQAPDRRAIEQRLAALDTSKASAVDKEATRKALTECLAALEAAERSRLSAIAHARNITEIDATAQSVDQALEKLKTASAGAEESEGLELAELEQRRRSAAADLDTARKALAEIEREGPRRRTRLQAIPKEIADARSELQKLDATLSSKPPSAEQIVQRAVRDRDLARRVALTERIKDLESEQQSYTARTSLLPRRVELARQQVAHFEKIDRAWEQALASKQKASARRAADRARELAAGVSVPTLTAVAEQIAKQSTELDGPDGLVAKITQAEREVADKQKRLDGLRRNFATMHARLVRAGLNDATGSLLRRGYGALPPDSGLARELAGLQRRISAALLAQSKLDVTSEQSVEARVAELVSDVAAKDRDRAADVARQLIEELDAIQLKVGENTDKLVDLLWKAETLERQHREAVDAYEKFARERILWIRNVADGSAPSLPDSLDAVRVLAGPSTWTELARSVLGGLGSAGVIVLLLALLVLLAGRGRLVARLGTLAPQSRSSRDAVFSDSLKAVVVTVLLALPLPIAAWTLAFALASGAQSYSMAIPVSEGLATVAWLLLALCLLRSSLRNGGLCDAQLGWDRRAIECLRRQLSWYTPITVLCTLIGATLAAEGSSAHQESLGRIALISNCLALATLLGFLARPAGPIVGPFLDKRKSGLLHALRWLLYSLLIATPGALALLAFLGFAHTAQTLSTRIVATLLIAFALLVAHGLCLRWWLLARRRIAIAAHAAKTKATEAAPEEVALDDDQLDLPALDQQTRRLLRLGMAFGLIIASWAVWAESLPALKGLERVQIWPSLRVVATVTPPIPQALAMEVSAKTETAKSGDNAGGASTGNAAASPRISPMPLRPSTAAPATTEAAEASDAVLTLADLIAASLTLLLTWLLVTGLPPLIDGLLLQRLSVDAGSRYAISTLLRYGIWILGAVLAFRAIGIGWQQVQWLAAALTFGLAFGLQEIFANFVSGLIILAERPVRIGDVVTVGTVTGYVSRIRMRSTTIQDFDRKELLVPNKEFITGQLVNWSLTDSVVRIRIPVGIAYGSDVDKARRILLEIADDCPLALDKPKPKAIFEGFGDSSLNFEIRVFVDDLDDWPKLLTLINTQIHERFATAGIEIPFPQRDLHLRTAGPITELIQRQNADGDAEGTRVAGP